MAQRFTREWLGRVALLLATGSVAMCPREALGSNPYLEVLATTDIEAAPAYVYANATNDEVRRLLTSRQIPFAELGEPAPGVRLPGRLTGRLHGVWIHGTERAENAATTPYEILDGRLALALDDFAAVLTRHGIIEVVHYTMYRPAASPPEAGVGLFRHAGGLAIDIGVMRRANGTRLSVEKDWSPAIAARTCGPNGRVPEGVNGRELVSLVCEARDLRLFHYALTPHFNRPHSTHVHFEVKPGVKWLLYN